MVGKWYLIGWQAVLMVRWNDAGWRDCGYPCPGIIWVGSISPGTCSDAQHCNRFRFPAEGRQDLSIT
jgi:hypothetical protein